jgi:hypothetical protein
VIDFTALQQIAAVDAGTLRRELDPRYVLHVHGHEPAAYESGRALYHSPFRQDNKPSYTVRRLEDGTWRCGDYARGKEGDVFDLIQQLQPNSSRTFAEAVAHGTIYLRTLERDGWTAPPLTAAPPREVLEDKVVEVIRTAPLTSLTAFLSSRDGCLRDVPPEFLRYHYGVAEIGDALLIPYTDTAGSIAALKKRAPGEGTKSLPGFQYGDLLYGLHRLCEGCPVMLCEGETDVWAAAYHLSGVLPLGVPTGAGRPPTEGQLALLQGREVYVCFDADEAGDAGAALWPFPRIRPPEGKDLASLDVETLRGLMP